MCFFAQPFLEETFEICRDCQVNGKIDLAADGHCHASLAHTELLVASWLFLLAFSDIYLRQETLFSGPKTQIELIIPNDVQLHYTPSDELYVTISQTMGMVFFRIVAFIMVMFL